MRCDIILFCRRCRRRGRRVPETGAEGGTTANCRVKERRMTETANCFLPAPKILPHHSRLAAQRMSCLILLLLLLLYTMREYSRPSVVRNNNITHNCFFHFPRFQHYCPRAQVPAVYELIFVGMITCLRLFVFAGDTVRRRLRPHTPRPRVITNTISSCCR